MANVKVLGIDLAKNIFQLHGANHQGKRILSKRLTRSAMLEYVAQQQPCIIAIEACTGAHHWARSFIAMGHTVKMMAPQFVKPYVKSNKNDRNDAAAIAEAATRPEMKFVPIKTVEQQDLLLSHRARELAVKHRTAQANQIRGLLAEYGIIIPQGIRHVLQLTQVIEDNQEKLTVRSQAIFKRLHEQLKKDNEQVQLYDKEIEQMARENELCQKLMKIEGVGPLTASAAVGTIGDAKVFKNGREVAAWLGMVPKQHSSGNKIRLGGISKRGDRYMRTLLIHGARSVVITARHKTDRRSMWVTEKARYGINKAAVALANKNARIIWAILATGECYRPSECSQAAAA